MTGWKPRIARVGLGTAMVASMLGASAAPSSAVSVKWPMAVVARDFQFIVPSVLPAGQYDLQFFNISRDEFHVFIALKLGSCSNDISTLDEARGLIERIGTEAEGLGGQDADFDTATEDQCPGTVFEGAAQAGPGGRDRQDFNFVPGKTLYFCPVADEDGAPHFDLGMIGFMNIFALPTGR